MFFVVTKLVHAYYRMGGYAFKKFQVRLIALLCRVLCFIDEGKNSNEAGDFTADECESN